MRARRFAFLMSALVVLQLGTPSVVDAQIIEGKADRIIGLMSDGKGNAVTATADGALRFWQLDTGECLATLKVPAEGATAAVVAAGGSPDGRFVALGGQLTAAAAQPVWIYDTAKRSLVTTLPGFSNLPIRQLSYSPDGKYLAATDGHSVRLWSLADGAPVKTWPSAVDLALVAVGSREGHVVVYAASAGQLYRCDPDNTAPLLHEDYGGTIASLAVSPTGDYVAVTVNGEQWGGRVLLLDAQLKKMDSLSRQFVSSGEALAFSPDGSHLAAGTIYSSLKLLRPMIYSIRQGRLYEQSESFEPFVNHALAWIDNSQLAVVQGADAREVVVHRVYRPDGTPIGAWPARMRFSDPTKPGTPGDAAHATDWPLAQGRMQQLLTDGYLRASTEKTAAGDAPQNSYMDQYGHEISQTDPNAIVQLLKEMEKTPYPIDEYFLISEVQPAGYSNAVKSPLLHAIVDDAFGRQKMLETIWLYFLRRRHAPEVFTLALNTRNTKGETFLDYIESMIRRNGKSFDPEYMQALRKLTDFAGIHGGVYSYHAMTTVASEYPAIIARQSSLAKKGDATAIRKLAEAYEFGVGVPKDVSRAFAYYELGAATGEKASLARLADKRYLGIDQVGADWVKTAALYDKLGSIFSEAELYNQGGHGLEKDQPKALTLFIRSFETGEQPVAAAGRLAEIYEERGDFQNALTWLLKGDEKYDQFRCLKVAEFYYYGKGTGVDRGAAALWQERYLETGDKRYAVRKWIDYLKDHPDMLVEFERLAANGNGSAQFLMGKFNRWNSNPGRANDWFKRAANNGNLAAQVAYGESLLDKDSPQYDPAEGKRWILKAAAADYLNAKVAAALHELDK